MGNPHILVVPFPAQGHAIPLMELSQILIKHGIKITFVNTEFNHKRITNALGKEPEGQVHFVSIPDGMGAEEDRNHIGKFVEACLKFMPSELKQLIEKINQTDDDEITCVLADMTLGLGVEVAAELGIKRAALWPPATQILALILNIPKLIDDGVIDENGTPLKHEMIQLSLDSPVMNPSNFLWMTIEDFTTQKIIFDLAQRDNIAIKKVEWLLCNSTYNLEAGAFALVPKALPIGPLSELDKLGNLKVNFWPEDSSCLKWLDQQPPRSTIYVAFGSFTVLNPTQFQELALGLELSNRPFLWVVRPDIIEGKDDAYPEGFHNRVVDRGRMVGWAPQRAVLSHPSIACFISHCGWNSTMEGLSNGVPFLCWPYFGDQFLNESYICDIWKVGLKFEKDENEIIRGEEIKSKVEKLLSGENFKARALELMEKTMNSIKEGGSSEQNLKSFIEWVKS
ncbi:hypothetical protein SLEP1_g20410 [Rubroshorea leprosula]|uniref:UDP-glycosyltransferase n=1 Tax=Rubroshorea leprosula TaxID=152421 RepID=A0AAV5JBL6_9ROSI|nr:hypothetical protein SLEP1_g20410 [Rubroshorea leprosula]